VATSLFESAGGVGSSRIARAAKLTVGEFDLPNSLIGEGTKNLLGMGVLSRFRVTFDFPNNKMYLAKGKRFAEPETWDLSGLHLLRKGGKTIVHSVDKGSAADIAGIKTGNRIAEFDGRAADSVDMFDLRKRLTVPGPLGIAVANELATTRVNIVLKRLTPRKSRGYSPFASYALLLNHRARFSCTR